MFEYLRQPEEIYRRSFATINAEADLDNVPADIGPLAIRIIHACGMIDIVNDLRFSRGAGEAGRTALGQGATVLVDASMVGSGIIGSRLPAANKVICTLDQVDRSVRLNDTRSARAVELWRDNLKGSVVAIGNAPTALFRLLEIIAGGAPKPALILGFPVGFVGAAESKDALIAHAGTIPYVTLRGRRGGSAMAAAAINALAGAGQ